MRNLLVGRFRDDAYTFVSSLVCLLAVVVTTHDITPLLRS